MIIKNFFAEDLEIESTSEEVEQKLENTYGIPVEMQKIYKRSDNTFLVLKNNKEKFSEIYENSFVNPEKKPLLFQKINKTGLADVDSFIKEISASEQELILEKTEDYISCFLEN